MQTRSMTLRAGVPHDLEAFNSYADPNFDPYEPPPMPSYDEVPCEIKEFYDPTHFCPSWVDCCEKNLALKPKTKKTEKNKENTTRRNVYTRAAWKKHIEALMDLLDAGEICEESLTQEEYTACYKGYHGK